MVTVSAGHDNYAKWFVDEGYESLKQEFKDFEEDLDEFTTLLHKIIESNKDKPWGINIEKMKSELLKTPFLKEISPAIFKKLTEGFSKHANMLFLSNPECMAYSEEYPNGLFDYEKAVRLNEKAAKNIQKLIEDPDKSVEILKYRLNPDDSTYYPDHYFDNEKEEKDEEA